MRRLLALVVILATLLPAAPAYAQAAPTNVLTNPDFEGDSHGVGCCSNVANGWTHFYRIKDPAKDPAFANHEPQYGNNRGDRRQNGNGSMSWGKDYATFDGGIWQRVQLPAATGKLKFTAWMTSWSGNGNSWGSTPQASVGKLIGIDPTGATDVWASSVIWSAEDRTAVDWVQLNLTTDAKSNFATVFIRGR